MPEDPVPSPVPEEPTLDLAAHRSAGSFGRYRLLQRLGEGGMGEVWLAEQTEPVRRQVALKVIKAGMDSAQVVARFEAERQALALMDHPTIATVFDGGTTPQGRPYFAMEYVKGEPITAYCDRHRLSTRERLELFMQVCDGVQHAHQKGIIHRDLKPSNVLVSIQDDRPVPKIIDFGVAKATTQHLTERSLFTELGVLIGTPEYMSPEQAEMGGLDIDTRTDIYALGVLLYELLTGSLPFDHKELRQAGIAEIQRIIREKEPPRPSTRITQLGPASTEAAKNRHTEPRRLASDLRGDLDWITMRALQKDRTRRYQTANALFADIRRHLNSGPVLAGPPSTGYRAGKFVRRHRFGVATAGVLATLLVGFSAALAIQAARIATAREEADRRRKQAEGLIGFMLGDLRTKLEPVGRLEILDDVGAKAVEYFASVPGESLDDEELLRRSKALHQIGSVRIAQGRLEAAMQPLQESLALVTALVSRRPDDAERLYELGQSQFWVGFVHWQRHNYDAASEHFRAYLDAAQRLVEKEPDNTEWRQELASAHSNLASVMEARADLAGALEGFRAVLELDRALLARKPDDAQRLRSIAASHNAIGGVLRAQGRLAEALEHHRAELAIMEQVVREHPDNAEWRVFLGVAQNSVGIVLEAQGMPAPARSHFETAVALLEPLVARDPTNMYWQRELGVNVERMGNVLLAGGSSRGIEYLRRSVAILGQLATGDPSNVGR